MRRGIFNSDESRTKFDLDFFSYFWWLRSAGNHRQYNTQFNYGVVPTCMI